MPLSRSQTCASGEGLPLARHDHEFGRSIAAQFSPDELLEGTLTGVKVADGVVIPLPDREPSRNTRSVRRRLR